MVARRERRSAEGMSFWGRSLGIVSLCAASLGLAACQGSTGSGSGFSLPGSPQSYGQPGGPNGVAGASTSRQQILDGAVTLTPETTEIPLPTLSGFSVTLALGTPGPSGASPSPGASGSPGASPAAAATPVPSPSISPSPSASGAKEAASAAPSPAGSPGAGKIATKTTIYPDDAPVAPTPEATGNVQTFVTRVAIVRGFVQPGSDVTVAAGAGGLRFTIPQEEQTTGRTFGVAIFQAGKKKHATLLASDPSATLANNVVSSAATGPALTLKKGMGYLLVLFGDPLPATPAPNYPGVGNNPFPAPTYSTGATYPGQPGQPGQPYGAYATATPYGMSPVTPTPYPGHQ